MRASLSSLAGKRVLITGDTGFKGSWLALWLTELGAEVTGFALAPEGDRPLFDLLGLRQYIRHVDGDIRDLDQLARVFDDTQPEVVLHLAAQALVRLSYAEPKRTMDTNIGGSVNLLECVRACPSVRSVVYITSDKCYENKEWVWGYRETDELGGRDPYSASKAAAELVFSAYCSSFFDARPELGIASARAGNVIGGGDWALDRIIPDCIRALEAGRPVPVRNPSATRPWQHVLEPLSGYLTLAARLLEQPKRFGGSWNFGPPVGSARNVGDLVKDSVGYWGEGSFEITPEANAPHEARLLQLNTDRAAIDLNWRSRWNVDQTIERTIGWYRQVVREGASPRAVCQSQIVEYMEAQR
ncbi:MAG: CDP-glucose 4,6-dehydratase [Rhodospirillaceae bacterium]|nr:CDP-glucose 4,6-dehydratase [Rhodospirillales bacterium]